MPALTRIQLRRGNAADWTSQVLYQGEIGLESDTGKYKIGDGSTVWSSLPYASVLPSELNELVDDRVANLLVAGSNISLTYNDSANTLTIATDGLDTEQVEDIIGTKIIAGSNISVSYDDTSGNTTISVTGLSLSGHTHTSSEITDFNTAVDARLPTISNATDNRLLTSTGTSTGVNAEANATFNGTTLTVTGAIAVDNLSLDGNTISSTDSNGNIVLAPNGTGDVQVDADTLRVGDSNTNATITSNGTGNLILNANSGTSSGNIVIEHNALTPNINLNAGSGGNVNIVSANVRLGVSNTNVLLTTNGTGKLTLSTNGTSGNGNVQVGAGGDTVTIGSGTNNGNIIVTGGADGNITLDPNGTGVVLVKATTLYVGDGGGSGNITSGAAQNLVLHAAGGGAGSPIINVAYGTSGNVDITAGTTGKVKLNSEVVTSGDVTVGGNLLVNGNTVTVNSTTVTVDDPIFTLGGDTAPLVDDNKDRGIEFQYYNGSAKVGFFGYDDSTGKFTFIPDAINSSEVFSGTIGEIDAKIDWTNINNKPDPVVTVTLEGDVTGTANTTLTDLASGTITVNTTIASNSVALGSDTTGNYVAGVSAGSYATVSGSGSENATVTIGVDATSANTASKVVARDASGDFSAGTITATLSGTATNALNIEVDVSSANTNYLVFVNGTDSNLKPLVNSNIRFDAANNELLGDDATTPTTALKYFIIDGGTP